MYVNPFHFGVFLGVIGTFTLEVVILILAALSRKGGKK